MRDKRKKAEWERRNQERRSKARAGQRNSTRAIKRASPQIVLPVERVSIVLPVEHLIGETTPEPQAQQVKLHEPKLSTGEQSSRESKARRILETKEDLLTSELASEISKLMFWLNGEYGFALAEKATDVSREAEADRQAHWHKVERKMLEQWKAEELEEMEEEYRCSLIRIPPFTELVARAGFNDALRTLIQDIAKSLAKEHKRRRKVFEESIPKPTTKTPETRRLAKKTQPTNRRDVELMDFITKRLVTHAFLLAKTGR